MALTIGIVGLPNVGKSTLFNAITNASVEAQNYPFCTIEPHSGIVPIPDKRLQQLAAVSGSKNVLPATIEFKDIAGLVKGASKGEGLGNKFLSNIRETDAIIHMVRCFEDDNIIHVDGKIDPLEDIDTINTELLLADLEQAEKMLENQQRRAKSNQKEEVSKRDVLDKIKTALEKGTAVRLLDLSDSEKDALKGIHFLTNKKVIYVSNVAEDSLGDSNALVDQVREFAKKENDEYLTLCANLEHELSSLSEDEQQEYLKDYGIDEPGLHQLARASFKLLGLQSYLTSGEKETRAWTIKKGATAPQAAGVIHTDFEKGFIRANVISLDHFIENKGWKQAKDKGLVRQEGKDYIMQENDVVEFLFNV